MKYLPFLLLTILLISCKNEKQETPVDFTSLNQAEIENYIAENNLNAQKSDSGLYYVINEPGTGKQPTASSNVTVVYKGHYTDKSIFDQSDEAGISFGLQEVIRGWTEGIPYFKEGGSGILLIPSDLGYGPSDYRGIPGGSVLIFDINLISVN